MIVRRSTGTFYSASCCPVQWPHRPSSRHRQGVVPPSGQLSCTSLPMEGSGRPRQSGPSRNGELDARLRLPLQQARASWKPCDGRWGPACRFPLPVCRPGGFGNPVDTPAVLFENGIWVGPLFEETVRALSRHPTIRLATRPIAFVENCDIFCAKRQLAWLPHGSRRLLHSHGPSQGFHEAVIRRLLFFGPSQAIEASAPGKRRYGDMDIKSAVSGGADGQLQRNT